MIYYSNQARKTARDSIAGLIIKLAETPPTDQFTLQNIQDTIHYLKVLDGELKRENKLESMRGHV